MHYVDKRPYMVLPCTTQLHDAVKIQSQDCVVKRCALLNNPLSEVFIAEHRWLAGRELHSQVVSALTRCLKLHQPWLPRIEGQ